MSVISGIENSFGKAQALAYGAQTTVTAVPVTPTVGGAANVNVQTTAATQVASYTPAEDGVFELSANLHINNGTSGNSITLRVDYTDAESGNAATLYFTEGATVLNAAPNITNGFYSCHPLTVVAKGGTIITVTYTDAGNTPNDYVTTVIKQVA
ncbi:MAG: hypothetical protein K6T83_03160 [Alicyclobacillus sp.]|nr:hypothetical protein [Alicyclobacillus sp.]